VFVPFAMIYMEQPLKLDFLWAGVGSAGGGRVDAAAVQCAARL
jgi:uncharacterized protein (DUF486 family)